METLPLVSILINNYNYGHFLADAIDSALNQTYPHIEVVVVDDGSSDNSREIIARYTDRIKPILKSNGGQASAFNAGFKASQGDLICFLDSDDIFLLDKIEKIAYIFNQYPDIGWCFHLLKLFDNETGSELQDRYFPSEVQGKSDVYDVRSSIQQGRLTGLIPCLPATSGLCFRRSLLAQILPMPEAESVSISDSYIKYIALALSPGFCLLEKLGLQRIHQNNIYTLSSHNSDLSVKLQVVTAYWMKTNFPMLHKYTNTMLACGIYLAWNEKVKDEICNYYINAYLSSISPWQIAKIYARAIYYFLKQ
ncbi:MAG TPA: glycosyltransferase family 2 protein [Candidatus Obscuribacterales bacterium]